MKQLKKHKGFTLLELLVSISIIGILLGIGSTSFRVANQKARDGRRQGDLQQIRAALELYRTDVGSYPAALPEVGGSLSAGGTTYMSDWPGDPKSGYLYAYTSASPFATYVLCSALELGTVTVAPCGSCGTGITCRYKVSNPL